MGSSYRAFKEKLDLEHQWPSIYMFKFIVPKDLKSAIPKMFPDEKISTRESKEGNYISYTIEKMMNSSDEVISIYEEAHKIEGIIAL
jgi:putative lipoic acid-binding regulatory protein